MPKIRVLVADEVTLFREGVCAVLKLSDDIETEDSKSDDDNPLHDSNLPRMAASVRP